MGVSGGWPLLLQPVEDHGAIVPQCRMDAGAGRTGCICCRFQRVDQQATAVLLPVLGVPYAALLAVLGGAVQLVPWLGVLLAVLPLLLVALINNPTAALLGAGYALVVSLLFEFRIQPRYFPRLQTNSLLLLIVAMVLALELGLAGLILAPAATVAVTVLWTHLVEPQRKAAPASVPTAESLESELSQLREAMGQATQPPAPEVASLVNRLDGLITASKEL